MIYDFRVWVQMMSLDGARLYCAGDRAAQAAAGLGAVNNTLRGKVDTVEYKEDEHAYWCDAECCSCE